MSEAGERLRRRILAGGPIPFAAFMEEALYGPGGYYAQPRPPIGPAGDYVTGSSVSPLFGRATARLLRRLDRLLEAPADLLEAGYGGGDHLEAVLDAAPAPPGRRLLGWERLPRPLPAGAAAVAPEQLTDRPIRGLVFSYELFDAQPVHRLLGRAAGPPGELWVDLAPDGGFRWREGTLSDPSLAALLPAAGPALEPGQIADLSPLWRPLYRRLAATLERGLLVTCDYGFEAPALLDPRIRRHGTLACYRRHSVHRDPFAAVGEQDLTAHVDLSALIDEGERAGLATVALTRQARWLGACGLFEDLAEAGAATRAEARTLLDPAGMGEEIRVLVQARGVDPAELFDLAILTGFVDGAGLG